MRECQHNQVTALTTPITRPQVKSVATINDEQVHNSQEDDWIKSQINTNYKVSLNLLRHNTWQNRSNARVSLVWPSPRLVKTKRLRRPRQVQTGPSSTVQYSACTPVLGGMPGSGQVSTGGLQQVVWQLGKTLLYYVKLQGVGGVNEWPLQCIAMLAQFCFHMGEDPKLDKTLHNHPESNSSYLIISHRQGQDVQCPI